MKKALFISFKVHKRHTLHFPLIVKSPSYFLVKHKLDLQHPSPPPLSLSLSCVASVSVGFGSKERLRNRIFSVLPQKMGPFFISEAAREKGKCCTTCCNTVRSMINNQIDKMQELGISAIALSINSELTELLESSCKTVASHL